MNNSQAGRFIKNIQCVAGEGQAGPSYPGAETKIEQYVCEHLCAVRIEVLFSWPLQFLVLTE